MVKQIFVLFFLFCSLQLFAIQYARVGVILASHNDVIVINTVGHRNQAHVGTKIFRGDRIETGQEGFVKLLFTDRSVIKLAGNSEINIDKYVVNNETEEHDISLKLFNAHAEFFVSKVTASNYKVKTLTAGLDITGTKFILQTHGIIGEGKSVTKLTVIEGEVKKQCLLTGKQVVVGEGQSAIVGDGYPEPLFVDSPILSFP
jgi:hypothetical protein